MIEAPTTRRIACAYSQAHEERAQAFKRLFRLPRVTIPQSPLSRLALTVSFR